jgi:3-isopropylmalate/(R)-2-methylmalate dehydratase small subunit
LGLPALFCERADQIVQGDLLMVDPVLGKITNKTRGETLVCKPIPDHLMAMVRAGGLIANLKTNAAHRDRA